MMMGEGAHASPWHWQHAVSGAEGGGYTGAGDDVAPYLLSALRDYLPSNEAAAAAAAGVGEDDEDAAAYAWDEFRMYEFKVRRCARGRSHDWTDCPFAHPGEKARRRDPRRYCCYSSTACPDFRKGGCKRGDACEAHGVSECWLHPARYRTQACKDGTACRRRVCFFAHTPDQLRALPQHQQGSSRRSVASSPLAVLRRLAAPPPGVRELPKQEHDVILTDQHSRVAAQVLPVGVAANVAGRRRRVPPRFLAEGRAARKRRADFAPATPPRLTEVRAVRRVVLGRLQHRFRIPKITGRAVQLPIHADEILLGHGDHRLWRHHDHGAHGPRAHSRGAACGEGRVRESPPRKGIREAQQRSHRLQRHHRCRSRGSSDHSRS